MNGVKETLSLRPLSLRPGSGPGPSGNPFAAFAKGAGAGSRPKVGCVPGQNRVAAVISLSQVHMQGQGLVEHV